MFSYKGLLLTGFVNDKGNKLSEEVIEYILQQQPEVPVRINFNGATVGKANKYERTEEGIICSFSLSIPDIDQLNLFVVPGGTVHINDITKEENGNITIQKMNLTELSITSFPTDEKLTKIEKDD